MMRLFFMLLLAVPSFLFGQSEKEVSSTLDKVTVFLSGAQLERIGKSNVPAGSSQIRFTGLSSQANPESVIVGAKGDFTILSVEYRINYLANKAKSPEVERLEKEMKTLDERYADDNLAIQSLNDEQNLLLANTSVSGKENGVIAANLEALANLYRVRLPEVRKQVIALQRQMAVIATEKQKLYNQLNELNAKLQSPNLGEVVVVIDAPNATNGEFGLSYYVPQANWQVQYDLRVADLNSPIQLDHKAVVQQNTGEKWDNVHLVISNGNPMQNNQRPFMSPWYLQVYQAFQQDYKAAKMATNAARPMTLQESKTSSDDSEIDIARLPTATASESGTNIEFDIKERYTIESGNKPRTVNINRHQLKTDFIYYCAPKLDCHAYLMANVTEWSDLYLMPGEANIYIEGSYTGKTMFNTNVTNDTLELSLGRDNGVSVKRNRQTLKDREQFLGPNRFVNRGWNIEVRNGKRSKIKLLLRDQIPLSTNKETVVELLDKDGARLEENTGFLTWELELKPGQTEKKSFKYSIKFPKDINYSLE